MDDQPAEGHEEEMMTTPDDRDDQPLDDLEAETVEDLDVAEDAEDVAGGPAMTTGGCFHR